MDMLLTEPGSRIDGPTEDVLRVIFESTWYLLRESTTDDRADDAAMRLVGRLHEALRIHGYIVRDFAG
jgi:hypothetical protein